MGVLFFIIAIIISYILGSIPTAYILGRLKGIDIRQCGSGNIGATNAFRVLGKLPGTIALLLDMAKGFISVTLIGDYFSKLGTPYGGNLFRIILGFAVVSGHNWTIFLKFKGGKGMATSLGVLAGLGMKIAGLRMALLLGLIIWVVTVLITRYVSIGSIITSIALPILMLLFNQPFEIVLLGVIFCLSLVWRHKSNINRLLNKEEPKIKLWG
jgi:glycerol-3-phosphate acyltransferase PlsY